MNNALYFTRNQNTEAALKKIIEQYNLELAFDDGKEKIYENDNMLFSLAKKYLFFFAYDSTDEMLIERIKNTMYSGGRKAYEKA